MKNQFLKTLTLALILLGLTSSPLFAQLGIKSVGSVQKKDGPMQVTVVFSEPVDAATAAVADNYSLGAGVTINTASMMTSLPGLNEPGNGEGSLRGRVIDNQCVVLDVTGLGTAQTTLTATGITAGGGAQTFTGSRTFVPSGYSWAETGRIYTQAGNPGWTAPGHREGKVIADSDNGFDIFNQGRRGWAGEDEFTFVYKPVDGDFDFKSRIEFQDFASRWSRAGIMVREAVDDGAPEGCMHRYCTSHTDPVRAWSDTAAGVVAGNNQYESNYRMNSFLTTSPECGDGTHAIGSPEQEADTAGGGGGTPEYPQAWLRLVRVGDIITAYYSNDGQNWSGEWVRDFSASEQGSLPTRMYLGPMFCTEWGNINTANVGARERYYLTQHRWGPLLTPYVQQVVGNPFGFVATVKNSMTVMVPSTLQLTLDGASVTATSVVGPDVNGVTTITYTSPTILAPTQHTVVVQFDDNGVPPNTIIKTTTFTVSYVSIPESYATTTFSGVKGTLMVSGHKMPDGVARGLGDNTTAATETQLQDGFIDPDTGQPYANNMPDMEGWTPELVEVPFNFTMTPDYAGYFSGTNPPPEGTYWDNSMPLGIGMGFIYDSFSMQFYGYADLKVGAYTMIVNSDDGFKLSFGPNALDVIGTKVGEYNGGRGVTQGADPDPGFSFVITKAGVYPFRLTFSQGAGLSLNDASIEWYLKDAAGNRILVNDPSAAAVKTYPNGRGRAYLKKFLPYPGSAGVEPRPTLTFQTVDDLTTVTDSSVKVILDGTDISSSLAKVRAGGTLTMTWTPAADYAFESQHTGEFSYTESNGTNRTCAIDFTIKGFLPADLPASSFWIEVEDFDFDRGKYLPVADTAIGTDPATAYLGGGYLDLVGQGYLAAVLDIDYHRVIGPTNDDGSLGGYVYRTDIPAWLDPPDNTRPGYFVPLGGKLDAGVANTRPGGVTVTVNYNTAWSGSSWYNYSRTVPNGIYNVLLAACWYSGDSAEPGYPGTIDSALDKVTAGVGTTSQTLQRLGTFSGPANGTTETLTVLKGSDGTPAVIKFGGKTTLRLSVNSGDSDYLALAPVSGVPAKITDATPANGAVASRSTPISVRIEDFNTTVTLNTVRLIVDTVDVTTQANPTKPADITTMSYTPAGGWAANSTHTYIVRFTDSASATTSVTNTFNVNALGAPGQFVVEAEDFNYGSGQAMPTASTMPYTTGAYTGLDAVLNVDYSSGNTVSATDYTPPNYRSTTGQLMTAGQQVCFSSMGAGDRGSWTISANYTIGWAGGGSWQNFTRTFPAGTYSVYAALSTGDGSDEQGSMALVTSGATTTAQTLLPLGTFRAPTGGGWGVNVLVPMKDPSGALATVNLGGAQTVRFTSDSGDEDYFLFVPGSTPVAASIVTPPANQSVAAGATATFTVAASGTGPLTYQWNFGGPVAGQTNATLVTNNAQAGNAGNYTVTVTGATGAPVTSAIASLTVTGGTEVRITSVQRNPDGTITLAWTGGGVLQVATSLTSPIQWQPVPTATSPYTFTPTPGVPMTFGRVVVP